MIINNSKFTLSFDNDFFELCILNRSLLNKINRKTQTYPDYIFKIGEEGIFILSQDKMKEVTLLLGSKPTAVKHIQDTIDKYMLNQPQSA